MVCPTVPLPATRFNANRAALVQSRIKALERMADVETVEQDSEYCFKCVHVQQACTQCVNCPALQSGVLQPW